MLTVPVCHRLGFKQARSPGSFRFVDLFLYDLDLDAYVVHAPSESDDTSEAESDGSSVARSLMVTVYCVYVAAANGPGWSGTAGL